MLPFFPWPVSLMSCKALNQMFPNLSPCLFASISASAVGAQQPERQSRDLAAAPAYVWHLRQEQIPEDAPSH